MIKAKLTTGEIIELVKDCDCVTHNGPHWLHTNDLWKERNRKLLEADSYYGHINEEIARLNDKEYELVSRGIEEIIRED